MYTSAYERAMYTYKYIASGLQLFRYNPSNLLIQIIISFQMSDDFVIAANFKTLPWNGAHVFLCGKYDLEI